MDKELGVLSSLEDLLPEAGRDSFEMTFDETLSFHGNSQDLGSGLCAHLTLDVLHSKLRGEGKDSSFKPPSKCSPTPFNPCFGRYDRRSPQCLRASHWENGPSLRRGLVLRRCWTCSSSKTFRNAFPVILPLRYLSAARTCLSFTTHSTDCKKRITPLILPISKENIPLVNLCITAWIPASSNRLLIACSTSIDFWHIVTLRVRSLEPGYAVTWIAPSPSKNPEVKDQPTLGTRVPDLSGTIEQSFA